MFECYKQQSTKLDTRLLQHLEEGLSWCAIDNTTGEIIGVRLCHGVTIDEVPETMPTYEEYIECGWSKEFTLVWLQEDAVFNTKEIFDLHCKPAKLLKLCGIGVHVDYRHKGIGSELMKRALIDASAKGYSLTGGICSSYYSQKLFEKQGFKKHKEMGYTKFGSIYNVAVCKGVDDIHKSIISYIKNI